MADPLEYFRRLCVAPADAVRWACVLEATAPKAGNVYPGQPFSDLAYRDFIASAEKAAMHLTDSARPMPQRILDCVCDTQTAINTNANLGILLLLGPLVAADQAQSICSPADWSAAVARQLQISARGSRLIFQAIRESSASGLGKVDQMDVQDDDSHDDIIAAMRLAKDRDRVALQYADGFDDLINHILPVVYHSLVDTGDLLRGISVAHIRLLAETPDTLISRKCGQSAALRVQRSAAGVDVNDLESCRRFDQSLRSSDHQLNPGTTADLIAAALYILLRTNK